VCDLISVLPVLHLHLHLPKNRRRRCLPNSPLLMRLLQSVLQPRVYGQSWRLVASRLGDFEYELCCVWATYKKQLSVPASHRVDVVTLSVAGLAPAWLVYKTAHWLSIWLRVVQAHALRFRVEFRGEAAVLLRVKGMWARIRGLRRLMVAATNTTDCVPTVQADQSVVVHGTFGSGPPIDPDKFKRERDESEGK